MKHFPATARRGRRGFTLVELLVVVAIIALLVSVLLPSLSRAKEITRRVVCSTSLHAQGQGWMMYWNQFNYRTPQTFNVLYWYTEGSSCGVKDLWEQFMYMIYCGNEHTTGAPDWVGAGTLYKMKYMGNPGAYVCPTYESKFGQKWFSSAPDLRNPWPPVPSDGTYMTYNTRRMRNYDDPALSAFSNDNFDDKKIMIWFEPGVSNIKSPSTFSWTTDRFDSPDQAWRSHVPGVNVLYLDGHCSYWVDPTWNGATGKILYNNGITGWGYPYNWLMDDIWMIIDGYHNPPLGQ